MFSLHLQTAVGKELSEDCTDGRRVKMVVNSCSKRSMKLEEVILSYFSVWGRVSSEAGQVVGFWGSVRILDVAA